MQQYRWLMALVVGAFLLVACGGQQAVQPLEAEVSQLELTQDLDGLTYTETWDGRGSDSLRCIDPLPDDPRYEFVESGWIHWVFATKGDSTDALLTIGNDDYEPGEPKNANVWHFYTPYMDLDELAALEPTITLFGVDKAPRGGGLVISDFCPGDVPTELNVVLSGEKSIPDILPPDPELAGWMIEIFFVIDTTNGEPSFAFDLATTATTDVQGEWTANLGPFAVDTPQFDIAVCEVERLGYYQVSPAAGDLGTILNPDDGRVCHLVTIALGDDDVTILGLDFTNSQTLEVSKTAVTSYTRTHDWEIAKKVETERNYTIVVDEVEYPKIWLYADGRYDGEKATWTVDVTYLGFADSAHAVSGVITIENKSSKDALITSIVDTLEWVPEDLSSEIATPISVDCGEDFEFPHTLPGLETLTCTYSYTFPEGTGQATGTNTVNVVLEEVVSYTASAGLTWGDPDPERYAEVEITDTNAGFEAKYGSPVILKAEDFEVGEKETFTYDQAFEYDGFEDCGGFTIDNTATIVELDKKAKAALKINVQCVDWESAWALGVGEPVTAYAFCDNGFNNWGWSNLIGQPYTGTWPLYAGAGQCEPERGTLVGTFEPVYRADGSFDYEFVYNEGILVEDGSEAVYAGKAMFPRLPGRNGAFTTAPGHYSIGELGGDIYVIAHSNVGIPDPDFGPSNED